MLKIKYTILFMLMTSFLFAQKIKVEWVSGDVKLTNKKENSNIALRKNDYLNATDRVYLGEKALLVVSDKDNNLFEIKKKGYMTGKEITEGIGKTQDNEYQRYLAYVLKELKSHETEMKASEKGIPGAPSRGSEFEMVLPDTIYVLEDKVLNISWLNGANTIGVHFLMTQTANQAIMDITVEGNFLNINNLNILLADHKQCQLIVTEQLSDGNSIRRKKMIFIKKDINTFELSDQIKKTTKNIEDPRLNLIIQASQWEAQSFHLKALSLYKQLLLDFPDDETVVISFDGFSTRTGLK